MSPLVRPVLDGAPPRPWSLRLGGLLFGPGTLTLVAGMPGAGKTSWLLLMALEALEQGVPAAYLSYEPSPDELRERLYPMAAARQNGPHGPARDGLPGAWALLAVLYADDRRDTLWLAERELLRILRPQAPAFLAVDYLQRVPAYDPAGSGPLPPDQRPGQAAAELRRLAVRHGWAVCAAAALRAGASPDRTPEPFDLLGSERAAYEADRVVVLVPGPAAPCGCREVGLFVVKDRRGPVRVERRWFWGERFYLTERQPPCLGGE